MKRQATNQNKAFAWICIKGHKELSKLNNEKASNPIKNYYWAKKIEQIPHRRHGFCKEEEKLSSSSWRFIQDMKFNREKTDEQKEKLQIFYPRF